MKVSVLALVLATVFLGAAPVVAAQQVCAELGGTVDSTGFCRIHETGDGYERIVGFPVDYPDQQAVADFLTQDRDGFVGWVRKFGQGRVYQERMTATAYSSATTRSLVFKIEDPTGFAHEAHPDLRFRSFTYDIRSGGPITIDTLFTPGTDPVLVLAPIVQPALKTRDAELVDPDLNSYRNFALTDDAVTFYFGESQFAPGNGPRVLAVPIGELAGLRG